MNEDEIFGAIISVQGIKEQMYTIETEVERKGADYKGAWDVLKAHIDDTLSDLNAMMEDK